ncbi:hypothetical protein FIBSPDRAFT_395591 [Athelia psychrophila]|uniref:Uncharacterized protein n=1 Tax=Athelia psychrophila TaxID=1759441 RepID=A0A166NN75_9AGAM|nr:hypothetical protein FIBSPDRAFT_395591 [Fibularhizoctonia sp. CBS 109695]
MMTSCWPASKQLLFVLEPASSLQTSLDCPWRTACIQPGSDSSMIRLLPASLKSTSFTVIPLPVRAGCLWASWWRPTCLAARLDAQRCTFKITGARSLLLHPPSCRSFQNGGLPPSSPFPSPPRYPPSTRVLTRRPAQGCPVS